MKKKHHNDKSMEDASASEIPEKKIIEENIDYKDRYLRAIADYQNLLKQSAKEKTEFARYSNEQILHELLPVYDNLKLAIEHSKDADSQDSWLEGVKFVVKQFKDVLNNFGIEEIEPIGQEFDYEKMDALEKRETEKEDEDNKVAEVVKPGYILHGKVIIHAKVIIFEYKKSSEVITDEENNN